MCIKQVIHCEFGSTRVRNNETQRFVLVLFLCRSCVVLVLADLSGKNKYNW